MFRSTACQVSVWIVIVAMLNGCDGGSSNNTGNQNGKLGSSKYTVLNDEDLALTNDSVAGNGKIAFLEPIGEIGAKKHYSLSFQLEDGGSLSLITHGNASLDNGVAAVFRRDGGDVKMKLVHGDNNSDEVTLDGLEASSQIAIGVDVHNDETPAHILIWGGDDFSEDAAVFNSEEDGDAPGNGKATFWGIQLNNATLSSSTISEAKFSEED